MKCTPQKTIASPSAARRLAREAERVADVVGHVLHLGHLVVVREDHRAALGRERAHLGLQLARSPRARAPRASLRGSHRQCGAIGRFMAATSRMQGQVQGGRRMGQRAHRHPFYPGLRARPERLERHAAARLELRAARRPGRRRRAAARRPCCPAAAAALRRRAPRRSPAALRTSTSSVPASSGAAARARATACAMPPAAAMWFSLIRIASYRPARWLLAPPAATAAFSSARSPGVVLRVSSTFAPVPSHRARGARGHRRHARQVREEVQRRALAGQQRAGAALDRQHRAALLAPDALLRPAARSAHRGSSCAKTASAASSP